MGDDTEREEVYREIDSVRCRAVALAELLEGAAPTGAILISEPGTLGISYILDDMDEDLSVALSEIRRLDGSDPINIDERRKG